MVYFRIIISFLTASGGEENFGYTLAAENENLFDIAARTGVGIEKIIDFNSFEEPFSVREGDRVWLK